MLYGANDKLTFYMPQIPLTGGCFSNFVAQKMLMGQMYLQFIFNAAKSSLEYITEKYDINCKIVACDNCFYAPYLMVYRDENGKMVEGIDENAKKTYMEYLHRTIISINNKFVRNHIVGLRYDNREEIEENIQA